MHQQVYEAQEGNLGRGEALPYTPVYYGVTALVVVQITAGRNLCSDPLLKRLTMLCGCRWSRGG